MALVGRRDGRNFGYGRQLSYAGPQALKDLFGGGHYGTVRAHSDRWQAFVKWCRSEQGPGINDARQIDRKVSPASSRNLIAPDESYLNVLQEIIRPARGVLHAHKLKGFHELRAAYACERYEQITQHRAPINGGQCCQVDKNLDLEARSQISYELGHGRIDVVAAYIGGQS